MSDPVYSFLPWVRSGVANDIVAADGDASVKVRVTWPLNLGLSGTRLDGGAASLPPVHRDVSLYGPGDVVGIDSKAVVKVEPRNWTTNFEPNYLPYVDFYDEDFPWRYTPAAADPGKHRLRPWITLLVLNESEFSDGKDASGKPLPYFELAGGVDRGLIFPASATLWAWAHVHANVDVTNGGTATVPDAVKALQDTVAANPDLAYARLLCPRHLEADTAYHAFVVPTFETGRLAGLGQVVPDTTVATASAWDANQSQFPYYYRWYFKTGDFGDFEYLVRLLQPRPVDNRVGVRDIDVLHPLSNLPAIDTPAELGGIQKLGGALEVPFDTLPPADQQVVTAYDRWDQPFPHPFEVAAAALINRADDYTRAPPSVVNPDHDPDPVITLPLYGRWHALANRVLDDASGTPLPNDQNWLHRLNLDPRFRVAAGIGTRVVQQNSQRYMAAAWDQVGDVIAANTRLRFAQLAQAVSSSLYRRHVAALAPERQLALTSPVHGRIMGSPTTVTALLRASVVPPAVTSGVFRRLTRPGAPAMRRLGLDASAPSRIVTGINAGRLHPAPPKVAPSGVIGVGDAVQAIQPAGEPGWARALLAAHPWLRFLPFLLLALLALLALAIAPLAALIVVALLALPAVALSRLLARWTRAAGAGASIDEERQTPASVDALPPVANFVITRPGTAFVPQGGPTDSAEAQRFKAGLRDVYRFTSIAFLTATPTTLDLATLTRTVVAALDPALTVARMLKKIVSLPPWLLGNWNDQVAPVMAYPVFDTPMYKPLADLGAELFLPNLNFIPPNSLTLLESNQRFIEAYMVGLNHEMARLLLWNEYPTDQRGSYFRQFWDVSTLLPPQPTEADKEPLRDIPPIHTWTPPSLLGTHNQREKNGAAALLTLVIRGELLKRYPTAVIYAQKAAWQKNARGVLDASLDRVLVDLLPAEADTPPTSKVRLPLFEAKIDPDIYFLGFDLSAVEARGGTKTSDDAGWFFVIKERPGEPRFGMGEATPDDTLRLVKWEDLEWSEAGVAPGGILQLGSSIPLVPYSPPVDLENKPDPADTQATFGPGTDAAALAYILYRVPVLVAVHASRMLPGAQS